MRLPQWIHKLLGHFKRKEPPRVEEPKPAPPAPVQRVAPPRVKPPRQKLPPKCMQTGKRSYASREIAARERDKLVHNTVNGYLRIYTCEFCGYWHLTHKKRYKW